jgi:hypothetical protein
LTQGDTRGLSSYTIRHGMVTQWLSKMGPLAAQRLMGHVTCSDSIYQDYDNGLEVMDVVAILNDEVTRMLDPVSAPIMKA